MDNQVNAVIKVKRFCNLNQTHIPIILNCRFLFLDFRKHSVCVTLIGTGILLMESQTSFRSRSTHWTIGL